MVYFNLSINIPWNQSTPWRISVKNISAFLLLQGLNDEFKWCEIERSWFDLIFCLTSEVSLLRLSDVSLGQAERPMLPQSQVSSHEPLSVQIRYRSQSPPASSGSGSDSGQWNNLPFCLPFSTILLLALSVETETRYLKTAWTHRIFILIFKK